MVVRNSFFLFLSMFLFSCGGKKCDSKEELIQYISDESNGYRFKKTIQGVDFIVQYKPTDVLVKQEIDEMKDFNEIEKLRKKYNKFMYFDLSMSANNQELLSNVVAEKAKFGQMVTDLAFKMDEKVHLFTKDNDTLDMSDFIYPRMYGLTNSTNIMIVYPRDKKYLKEEYLNLTVEDLGCNTGEVKFKLNSKQIINEPQLIFQ